MSESVLLWDKIGLEMKRVRAGHIGIYLTPYIINFKEINLFYLYYTHI